METVVAAFVVACHFDWLTHCHQIVHAVQLPELVIDASADAEALMSSLKRLKSMKKGILVENLFVAELVNYFGQ